MKIVKIPKGNGKFRTIYAPDAQQKNALRVLVHSLNERGKAACPHAHGFLPGRSPVTNAKAHVGRMFSVVFDLKDFFDTVKPSMVADCEPICFVDGAARQGLPTSPAVANLAAAGMDADLAAAFPDCVFTRYADDLTFSTDCAERCRVLLLVVPLIVREHGFCINDSKTHTLCAKAGRRVITGVAVGESDIQVPRHIRRNIRAALHQGNTRSARGLQEWEKLKPPVEGKLIVSRAAQASARALAKRMS